MLRRFLITVFLIVSSSICVLAQEATADLGSPTTSVGQPVEIVVTVRKARSADVPQRVDLPGLPIQLLGRQTRFEMNNYIVTSSLSFTYLATPERAGKFDIPPFEVRVEDITLITNSLRLLVSEVTSQPPPQPQVSHGMPKPQASAPQPPIDPPPRVGISYFGELVLSKNKAYIGEAVPIEFRVYFNSSNNSFSLYSNALPIIPGGDFTIGNFTRKPQREEIVNGENYGVITFQTAIRTTKTGMLQIPAARLEAFVKVPTTNSFLKGYEVPTGMLTTSREVAIESNTATLEVLPPTQKIEPHDFTGAVGKYKMVASVDQTNIKKGQPITLQVIVTGYEIPKESIVSKMFDPPILTNTDGWRIYPPSEKISTHDNFIKTYNFMLVANRGQTKTPGVRFNYLDVENGDYKVIELRPFDIENKITNQNSTVASSPNFGELPSNSIGVKLIDIWNNYKKSGSIYREGYEFTSRVLGMKKNDNAELEFDIGQEEMNKLFQSILVSDDASCQLLSGLLLMRGAPGFEKNPTDGFDRLKKFNSIASNYPEYQQEAQFVIGVSLINGYGVHADKKEGLRWIQRAAEKGHYGAKKFLIENNSKLAEFASSTPQPQVSPPSAVVGRSSQQLQDHQSKTQNKIPKKLEKSTPKKNESNINYLVFLGAFGIGIFFLVAASMPLIKNGENPLSYIQLFSQQNRWIVFLTLSGLIIDISGIFSTAGAYFTIPSISLVVYMLGGGLFYRCCLAKCPMGKMFGCFVAVALYLGWVVIYAFGTASPYKGPSLLMLMCLVSVYKIVQFDRLRNQL